MFRYAIALLITASAPAIAATPVTTGSLKIGVVISGGATGVTSARTASSSQLQQAPSRTFVDCSEGPCVKVIYY